jgi:hypothetical protein
MVPTMLNTSQDYNVSCFLLIQKAAKSPFANVLNIVYFLPSLRISAIWRSGHLPWLKILRESFNTPYIIARPL